MIVTCTDSRGFVANGTAPYAVAGKLVHYQMCQNMCCWRHIYTCSVDDIPDGMEGDVYL
jgi:hypothetical protein